MARGKHVLVILIVLECTGLADQRINHMTVIDRMLTAANQTGHLLDFGLAVPNLNGIGIDNNIHLVTDQSAVNRIRIPFDLDGAATTDFHATHLHAMIEPVRRKLAEDLLLLFEFDDARYVAIVEQLQEEFFVLLTACEIATPPQQEGLIDHRFQVTVR